MPFNKNQKNSQKNKINTRPAKNLRPINPQYTTNQKSNINITNDVGKILQSAENENTKKVEPNNQINKNNDIKQQENIAVVKEYKIDVNNNMPQNSNLQSSNNQFNRQNNNTLQNNMQFQNQGTVSLEKTNEILQQINDYLDKEKKNLQ